MKTVKVWLAWTCFWIGHWFSIPMRYWDWTAYVCMSPYQKLMRWSSVLQGDSKDGPWAIEVEGEAG